MEQNERERIEGVGEVMENKGMESAKKYEVGNNRNGIVG